MNKPEQEITSITLGDWARAIADNKNKTKEVENVLFKEFGECAKAVIEDLHDNIIFAAKQGKYSCFTDNLYNPDCFNTAVWDERYTVARCAEIRELLEERLKKEIKEWCKKNGFGVEQTSLASNYLTVKW